MAHPANQLKTRQLNYEELARKVELLIQEKRQLKEDLLRAKQRASQLEIKLKLNETQVHNAVRIQNEFLDRLSHELLTPLNGILGMADLLDDTSLDIEQAESIQIIRKSGERLRHTFQDLLEYVHLSKGEIQITPSWFEPLPCIEEVIDLYVASIFGKDLEITLLDESISPFTIHADRDRIQQIVHILLSNAVKFTNAGHIVVRTKITKNRSDSSISSASHQLQIQVIDTGIGIDSSRIDSIFMPLRQLDESNTRSFEGLGIGLALCKEIIAYMGGSIVPQSAPGQGSTFTIDIPIKAQIVHDHVAVKNQWAGLEVAVTSMHEPNRSQLQVLTSSASMKLLNWPLEHIKSVGATPPTNIWIIDIPTAPSMDAFSFLFEVLNDHKPCTIALISPHYSIPAPYKKLFDIVVKKPLVERAFFDAIRLAQTLKKLPHTATPPAQDISPPDIFNNAIAGPVLLVESNTINQKIIAQMIHMLKMRSEIVSSMDALYEKLNTAVPYSTILINPAIDTTSQLVQIKSLSAFLTRARKDLRLIAIGNKSTSYSDALLKQAGISQHIKLPIKLNDFAVAIQPELQKDARKSLDSDRNDLH